MWSFSWRTIIKIDNIKSKFTLASISSGIRGCLQTQEQITVPIEDQKGLFEEDVLKKLVRDCICECYPDTGDIKIYIFECSEFIGGRQTTPIYNLNVRWINGASECALKSRVLVAIEEYYRRLPSNIKKPKIKPYLIRSFSEEVILETSKKYGDCIASNPPLNMHNIRCFKLGGVPIYDLALGELRLKKEVI